MAFYSIPASISELSSTKQMQCSYLHLYLLYIWKFSYLTSVIHPLTLSAIIFHVTLSVSRVIVCTVCNMVDGKSGPGYVTTFTFKKKKSHFKNIN